VVLYQVAFEAAVQDKSTEILHVFHKESKNIEQVILQQCRFPPISLLNKCGVSTIRCRKRED